VQILTSKKNCTAILLAYLLHTFSHPLEFLEVWKTDYLLNQMQENTHLDPFNALLCTYKPKKSHGYFPDPLHASPHSLEFLEVWQIGYYLLNSPNTGEY
jgi:hypothetical protein